MIAVALGLISLVVMIATGVVASSGGEDHLTFLGIAVQTTTAQVFVTGAIFGWLFLVAIWLLRIGIHRSGERCAELASRRRRPSVWLGFAEEADTEEENEWGGWDGWGRASTQRSRWVEADAVRFRTRGETGGAHESGSGGGRSGGSVSSHGILDGTGTARHGGGAPWRPDGRPDNTNRAVAGTADQAGVLGGDDAPGPVTGRFPGVGVDRGAQRRQIGGGPGPMAGEDRRAEGEHPRGDSGQ
ncbi:hypothetical protein GCM10009838_14520 [Catenulispora subtropica]|uniref:Uncharacterized protein n=1 Tax=Catenulispora subtropica TaxID=450798 RepID=A0ABP5C7P0_9ACTN